MYAEAADGLAVIADVDDAIAWTNELIARATASYPSTVDAFPVTLVRSPRYGGDHAYAVAVTINNPADVMGEHDT